MVHPVRLAAGLVTAVIGTTAMLGVPGQAAAAPGSATDHRYYQAAVNLLDPDAPGAGGFVGGVAFSAPVDGPASVNVFPSRATSVVCEDGSDDFATLTVRTVTDEATAPGPVSLEIDRRLRAAEGVAQSDLVEEFSPGCGQEPTLMLLPSQSVRIVVQGTTVRFRTGMESRASTGRVSARCAASISPATA